MEDTAGVEAGLIILVEGDVDRVVVLELLENLGLHEHGIRIIECGCKQGVKARLKNLSESGFKVAALVDADAVSVADSIALAQSQLQTNSGLVFCAVPTIEAWLFADPGVPIRFAKGKMARQTAERLPLPELIPYPKYVANQIFKSSGKIFPEGIAREMELNVAIGRSPSLAAFVTGILGALGKSNTLRERALSSSVSRDVLSAIVRELPATAVVWRTVEGKEFDAAQLATEIAEGTETGMQYATELLRVARDLVVRSAKIK